jgi:lipid-binding SYLF domain-containing protein
MSRHNLRAAFVRSFVTVLLCLAVSAEAFAQSDAERKLAEAADLIGAFTDNGPDSIPTELLQRARGIAVIPNVFRGGFILGARRGRGALSVRMPDGTWSNPAFVTLTGGSIGWQIGAESTDIVLVFANDNAVKNIATGKFTLGGEATAVAGPLRKQASSAMTFRAEIYGYIRSRGLYAGAAFQGARLDIDEELGTEIYGADTGAVPLGAATAATPMAARRFIESLDAALVASPTAGISDSPGPNPDAAESGDSEALTFPLPD